MICRILASVCWSSVASLFAEPGPLLLSEDFSRQLPSIQAGRAYTQKEGWRVLSGGWQITDGGLRGQQQPGDGRSAFVVRYFPFEAALIQFDVRLDGCRQVIFRIQDAKPEHICSVKINEAGFSVQKDDHDHGGPDTAQTFGKAGLPIKPGEWKTVQVEISGETLTAVIDGQSLSGSHPLIAAPKATFEFVVTGASASFRNVRVWEVRPKPR